MPTSRTLALAALAFAAAATPALAQTIRRGPVFNPANGSRYYALEANFASARAWAQQRLKGDLVTINSAAENSFIAAAFTTPAPQDKLQIGLNDIASEGTFVWADGSTSTYRNWDGGTPQSAGNTPEADIVQIFPDGAWLIRPDGFTPYTLVESTAPLQVPGEFPNLRDAITFALNSGGGVIEVAPGVHDLPSSALEFNSPLTIRGTGPGVEIRSTDQNSSLLLNAPLRIENAILLHRAQFASLAVVNAEGSVDLRDVTLRSSAGQAATSIFSTGSSVRIERSTVRDIRAIVVANGSGGSLTVVNSVIFRALGVVAGPSAVRTTITNCTLVEVGSSSTPVFNNGATTIANCLIVNPGSAFFTGTRAQVSYSIFPGAIPTTNNAGNNIIGVPLFVNAASGNFRLLPNSPGIDAGSEAAFLAGGATALTDLAGAFRLQDAATPNTGQGQIPIDMGAFELAAPAPCRADFNNDTELTFDDIQAFIAAYNSGC